MFKLIFTILISENSSVNSKKGKIKQEMFAHKNNKKLTVCTI